MKKFTLAVILLFLGTCLPANAAHDSGIFRRSDLLNPNPIAHVWSFGPFGQNIDLGTTIEDVWGLQGQAYNFPPVGGTSIWLSSTSTADVDIPVVIFALNVDYQLRVRTVTLNGQNFVAQTDVTWIAIYRGRNIGVIGNELVGNVYISGINTGTAGVPDDLKKVHGFILAGDQQTKHTAFTNPDGYVCYVTSFTQWLGISDSGNKSADIIISTRFGRGKVFAIDFYGNLTRTAKLPGSSAPYSTQLPPRTDIRVQAIGNKPDVNLGINYMVSCTPCGNIRLACPSQ